MLVKCELSGCDIRTDKSLSNLERHRHFFCSKEHRKEYYQIHPRIGANNARKSWDGDERLHKILEHRQSGTCATCSSTVGLSIYPINGTFLDRNLDNFQLRCGTCYGTLQETVRKTLSVQKPVVYYFRRNR